MKKIKLTRLYKTIIAVTVVVTVIAAIGASAFFLRPKGELLEYTGILKGSSQFNWGLEFTGRTLDITGTNKIWEKDNPSHIPLIFDVPLQENAGGKIIRVWGRKGYYTPKKNELLQKKAPYLKVERYEVMADISFVGEKEEAYRKTLPCCRLWLGGGSKWFIGENGEIQVETILQYNDNPKKTISLWYNGKSGNLIRIEGEENKNISCSMVEIQGKLEINLDQGLQQQWLTLINEDQIKTWGNKVFLEGVKIQEKNNGRMVTVFAKREKFEEVLNEQGSKIFKLKEFGYEFLKTK
jgi:hypothetical protein